MSVTYSHCESPQHSSDVKRTSWPPGTKYHLWKVASEFPLHRVQDRLEVGHLQPRSSQDKFRVVNSNHDRDGRLPLIDSTLLLCPRRTKQPHTQSKHSYDNSVSTEVATKTLPPPNKCRDSRASTNTECFSRLINNVSVGDCAVQPPSRLGKNSLGDWYTLYGQTHCNDISSGYITTKPDTRSNSRFRTWSQKGVKRTCNEGVKTTSRKVVNIASPERVKFLSDKRVNTTTHTGFKRRNAGVNTTQNFTSDTNLSGPKQHFLQLKSQIRTYNNPSKNTKKASKTKEPPHSHMIDHMTSNHGDVSPPPTPQYKGLTIGF